MSDNMEAWEALLRYIKLIDDSINNLYREISILRRAMGALWLAFIILAVTYVTDKTWNLF